MDFIKGMKVEGVLGMRCLWLTKDNCGACAAEMRWTDSPLYEIHNYKQYITKKYSEIISCTNITLKIKWWRPQRKFP